MEKIRAISLFSGAGGMDVGFERAGVEILVANEIMPEAAQTYKANHPNSIVMNDDINHVISSLKGYRGIDLVFGGPPCQGFSVAGKMNPDDIRNKLIAKGIPAEEIAYIHDAKTEQQKADLFDNINSNYGRFNSCFFMPPIIRGHFFCWSAACLSAYKRRGSFSEGCGDLGEHRP